jgi:hypothetical protein
MIAHTCLIVCVLTASCVDQHLETPKPLLPKGPTANHYLFKWLPLQDAEAYRITVTVPPHFTGPCHKRGERGESGYQVIGGRWNTIVIAMRACSASFCSAALTHPPSYSPETQQVLDPGYHRPLVTDVDCITGKRVVYSWTIQGLRGKPSHDLYGLPWKEESAPSTALDFYLDKSLPDVIAYYLQDSTHPPQQASPPPSPTHPSPPPSSASPTRKPYYVTRRFYCVANEGNDSRGTCDIKSLGSSCQEAASTVLALAAKSDVCRTCNSVTDNTRHMSGKAEWVRDGPCQDNP